MKGKITLSNVEIKELIIQRLVEKNLLPQSYYDLTIEYRNSQLEHTIIFFDKDEYQEDLLSHIEDLQEQEDIK